MTYKAQPYGFAYVSKKCVKKTKYVDGQKFNMFPNDVLGMYQIIEEITRREIENAMSKLLSEVRAEHERETRSGVCKLPEEKGGRLESTTRET